MTAFAKALHRTFTAAVPSGVAYHVGMCAGAALLIFLMEKTNGVDLSAAFF
jgi:hypothetical protein